MRGAVVEAALLLAAGLVVAEGSICRPGHTWWSPQEDACLNCTRCDDTSRHFMVIRPCRVHQDTVCGSLKDLGIDWSWLRESHNDHRHAKHRKKHENRTGQAKHRKIVWKFSPPDDQTTVDPYQQIETTQMTTTTIENARDELYSDQGYSDDYDGDLEVEFDSEPFTSDNQFVWDWQTVMLILAAFACLLFFVVVGFYSVYHATQWKILKNNLEADVEGLTAKLNLMMAYADSNQFQDSTPSSPDNQYSNVQCAYLEQLLVGKSKGHPLGPGNVYIQENNY